MQKILGIKPALFRPGFGNYNDIVRDVLASRGYTIVLWDVDIGDSTGSSVAQSKEVVKQLALQHPSNFLLLAHEVYEGTVYDVVPYALSTFQAAGYLLVTVDQCLGVPPYQEVGPPGERDGSWIC